MKTPPLTLAQLERLVEQFHQAPGIVRGIMHAHRDAGGRMPFISTPLDFRGEIYLDDLPELFREMFGLRTK